MHIITLNVVLLLFTALAASQPQNVNDIVSTELMSKIPNPASDPSNTMFALEAIVPTSFIHITHDPHLQYSNFDDSATSSIPGSYGKLSACTKAWAASSLKQADTMALSIASVIPTPKSFPEIESSSSKRSSSSGRHKHKTNLKESTSFAVTTPTHNDAPTSQAAKGVMGAAGLAAAVLALQEGH